jgi:hypothetical protein
MFWQNLDVQKQLDATYWQNARETDFPTIKNYKPHGSRNRGRCLKRLLDDWGRNRPTRGVTASLLGGGDDGGGGGLNTMINNPWRFLKCKWNKSDEQCIKFDVQRCTYNSRRASVSGRYSNQVLLEYKSCLMEFRNVHSREKKYNKSFRKIQREAVLTAWMKNVREQIFIIPSLRYKRSGKSKETTPETTRSATVLHLVFR